MADQSKATAALVWVAGCPRLKLKAANGEVVLNKEFPSAALPEELTILDDERDVIKGASFKSILLNHYIQLQGVQYCVESVKVAPLQQQNGKLFCCSRILVLKVLFEYDFLNLSEYEYENRMLKERVPLVTTTPSTQRNTMTEITNERDDWLAQIYDRVKAKVTKQGRTVKWSKFVQDVAWWLYTEKTRDDEDTIEAATGLIMYGIYTEDDLHNISPEKNLFRDSLVGVGVLPVISDMLFDKYVAPAQQQTQTQHEEQQNGKLFEYDFHGRLFAVVVCS
jgi:hypothetical protein